MSSQYRRPRGTPKVALNLFVAPEVKELIDDYAARANAPIWAIVEAAIRAGKPGADDLHAAGWLDCAPPFETAHFLDGFGHPDGRFRFAPDWSAIGPFQMMKLLFFRPALTLASLSLASCGTSLATPTRSIAPSFTPHHDCMGCHLPSSTSRTVLT